ncbi:MAG: glycosyltransferase family 2 protein [Acidobacteriaceae bacterium]
MKPYPYISIIIPVRNEEKSISTILQQLSEQTYPYYLFEVLVVDGMSTDSTRDIVSSFIVNSHINIRLIDNPAIRSGPGRNRGIMAAKGQYIIFIDGHTFLPSKSLLADTVELFNTTGAACLCRPQPLIAENKSHIQKEIAAVRATKLGHGPGSYIYNMDYKGYINPESSGASYAAWVFNKLGNYDESFDACEDVELNIRVAKAGIQAYTDPRIAVYYEARNSLGLLSKQLIRYGRGRIRLARKHPQSFKLLTAAPIAVFISIALAIIPFFQRFNHNHIQWILAVPFIVYLIIVLLSAAYLSMKRGLSTLFIAPIIYLCLHLSLGLGMLYELIFSLP